MKTNERKARLRQAGRAPAPALSLTRSLPLHVADISVGEAETGTAARAGSGASSSSGGGVFPGDASAAITNDHHSIARADGTCIDLKAGVDASQLSMRQKADLLLYYELQGTGTGTGTGVAAKSGAPAAGSAKPGK